MRWRIGGFLAVVVLFLSGASPLVAAETPAPTCSLCILEVQTIGQNGEEDQDFVIVANVTGSNITSSSIQLRYSNALGIPDSSLGIGTFSAGQVKVYATDTLRTINSSATKLPMALYSGGGTLMVARTSGQTTTVYDKFGWGSTLLAETAAAPAGSAGSIFTRKNSEGIVQDTDHNAVDFEALQSTCKNLEIHEIQPFVTDSSGQSVTAWVEVVGRGDEIGDCKLLTASGDEYLVPAQALPLSGQRVVVSSGLNDLGEAVPLHIGDASGQVWFAATSTYGGVNTLHLPIVSSAYSNLVKGQTWALIDGVWKRTFQPTPGQDNVYAATLPSGETEDPTACTSVSISEVLPNPAGEDTGKEWLELHNNSTEPASLAQCQVSIGGVVYNFLPDDSLNPNEWRLYYTLYSEETEKAISLRNSGETMVTWQRLGFNGSSETLQAFVYADAPEGQSYARFSEGWRWLSAPTPNLDNSASFGSGGEAGPTEFPAPAEEPSGSGNPPQTFLPIQITELLPNPAPPKTDENDEFVELFNPNDQTVNLKDYVLQTGTTYANSYTFNNVELAPGEYIVITSGNTSLTLSNSGGRARLLTPSQEVVSEIEGYGAAGAGQSWALVNGKWQWTTKPTPGTVNNFTVVPLLTTAKTTTTKKAATSKTLKKSTTKAKTASTEKASTGKAKVKAASTYAKTAIGSTTPATNVPPVHTSVLAIVGALALGYAAYEYRRDIRARLHQLQRYRNDRRTARSSSKGR